MEFTPTLPRAGRGDSDDVVAPADGSRPFDRTSWLGDLFRLESPWLNRFFRRRLGSANDAEDLTQEVFARFLRATPMTRVETPEAYLRTIAANLVRDHAAHGGRRWTQTLLPLDDGLDCPDEIDPERVAAARQELEHYERLLGQLHPRTLEVFLMSRVDGYRYAEIAARMGISQWTVKREMMKAIAHIDQARRAG